MMHSDFSFSLVESRKPETCSRSRTKFMLRTYTRTGQKKTTKRMFLQGIMEPEKENNDIFIEFHTYTYQ